jgi:UDP-N-acetylmuramyl-tripeptide synthetase
MIQFLKNIYHLIIAILANVYYGFPSRKIYVVGVTGTNGKTTTSVLIASILKQAGYKVGLISTIAFWIGDKKMVNKSKYTTVTSFKHQKFLKKCQQAGCEFVVLEVSSHALDQFRDWGTDYDLGVITNITREHLDYHKTMRAYSRAKRKLFKYLVKKQGKTKKGRLSGISIVNLAMRDANRFLLGEKNHNLGYYLEKDEASLKKKIKKFESIQKIKAKKIKLKPEETKFKVEREEFKLNLTGLFNVENVLAALGAAQKLKIKSSIIKKTFQNVKNIQGRLEKVENKKGIQIIIDYALTPDSMEKVGKVYRELLDKPNKNNQLIWVFGSCGDRDRGKRPIMGKIVSKYADKIILTNEDPYFEDPKRIIDEIYQGVDKKKTKIIFSRRRAIQKAIQKAKKNDIILITGKGAEETMRIKDKDIPWNDKRETIKILKKLNYL